ncbi:MAG: phosphoribosylglycinamide formyltransferase [Isosphaeraceae bacterium]|nr:phosphoribosylglycinamide formyltransferase [Isosphaeraceae bacterium]
MDATRPLRLAVLVSGGGTTLQNLIDRSRAGRMAAEVALVVASRAGLVAEERARRAGIPVLVLDWKSHGRAEFAKHAFDAIRATGVDLVVLGGFLHLLDIPPDFECRVINVHPSLIPAFCGKGFHGAAVHRAALDFGVKLSGCTVHFADATYDTGPIIHQRAVPVLDDDTPESLAARVFEAECKALPEAIDRIAAGAIRVEGRRVIHRPSDNSSQD